MIGPEKKPRFPHAALTEAEGYVHIALVAIGFANFPHELRTWWRDEDVNRARYRLSPDQEQVLIQACSNRIAEIEREAAPFAVV